MAADEADTPSSRKAAGRFHLTVDYDTDFDAWAQAQAQALRAKDWAALDLEHLAEEVEDLRKTERKGVRSQLRRLTSHLLNWAHQPTRRGESWQTTILDARRLVADGPEENGTLTRELPALFAWAYPRARRQAAKDTGLPLTTNPRHNILALRHFWWGGLSPSLCGDGGGQDSLPTEGIDTVSVRETCGRMRLFQGRGVYADR